MLRIKFLFFKINVALAVLELLKQARWSSNSQRSSTCLCAWTKSIHNHALPSNSFIFGFLRVSLYSLGFPEMHSVDQTGLEVSIGEVVWSTEEPNLSQGRKKTVPKARVSCHGEWLGTCCVTEYDLLLLEC